MMKYFACLLITLFLLVFPTRSPFRVEVVPAAVGQILATSTVATSFDLWIDRLGKNENCPPEGIIDSNGQLSYGRFCYQKGTFIAFVKKFRMLPQAEDAEIMNEIGDVAFQRALTVREFREDPNAWWHWQTTVGKIGMPPIK